MSEHRSGSFAALPWFRDPIFAQWISHHLAEYGKTICDVGAGSGNMLPYYAGTFDSVAAIEPSRHLAPALKREAAEAAVVRGIGELLPFRSKSRDVVVAKSSFHHFQDPEAAFGEMERVARHAVAIIETVAPAPHCLPFLRELLAMKEPERSADSIFCAEYLADFLSRVSWAPRVLFFDQQFNVDTWLENAGLARDVERGIRRLISEQTGSVRHDMQIHENGGHLLMLRRMCLGIAPISRRTRASTDE